MWQTEIMNGLIEIVKQGGFYGIIGAFVWGIIPTIKICVILILSFLIWRSTFTQILNLYLLRKYNKNTAITLLSKQTSKHLEESIKQWQKESLNISNELMKSVEFLRKNLDETKQETPAPKDS